MNWVITGGAGFVGTNLIERLLSAGGHSVRVIDDLSTGKDSYLSQVASEVVQRRSPEEIGRFVDLAEGTVELVVADIRDANVVRHASKAADVFIHLAANTGVPQSVKDPEQDCLTNVVGTLACLEAARNEKVGRFVFASSSAPLGEKTPPVHEEMHAEPASPYGASKLAGEGYCSAYHRCFGLETVALRFGNVYGPYSAHKGSVVARFIRRALEGKELEIHGDGKQTRDFIYTGDLVDAILLAARHPEAAGQLFQIATNTETTVNDLAALVLEELARTDEEQVSREHTEPRQGDIRRNFSDISKARQRLGWKPKTALREGLRQTIEWYLSNS